MHVFQLAYLLFIWPQDIESHLRFTEYKHSREQTKFWNLTQIRKSKYCDSSLNRCIARMHCHPIGARASHDRKEGWLLRISILHEEKRRESRGLRRVVKTSARPHCSQLNRDYKGNINIRLKWQKVSQSAQLLLVTHFGHFENERGRFSFRGWADIKCRSQLTWVWCLHFLHNTYRS